MNRLLIPALLATACGSKSAPTTPQKDAARVESAAPTTKEPPSPYDPKVWIAKLDDPRETERAVTELEQLGDPRAIMPLGDVWLAQGRPVRILQVMISIARPLTPEQARAQYVTDFEKAGRPPSWDKALPYLIRAIVEVDDSNPRSVDSATKASDALGEAKLGLDALVALARRPTSKKLLAAQIAAIRSMGRFANNDDAVKALIEIVARPTPPHPRTATDKQQARGLEETFGIYLASSGAAINALAELRASAATRELVLSMYRTPELFMQVRRALVASGPSAKDELRKALRGDHAEVNQLFADRKLDRYCGDRGERKKCERVSAKEFYPAIVLGDFYDPAAVPDLVAVLKRPALPPYFIDEQPAPNSQYNAAFDALRKIGAPDAADQIRQLWRNKKLDAGTRALAVAAYPFVARDRAATAELAKIAGDNKADDNLRVEAATALARLADSEKDIATFNALAARYLEAASDQAEKAAKAKDNRERKQAQSAATAYTGFARMFQTHIARVEIAMRCKQDTACYAASVRLTPNDTKNVERHITDLASWTADEKRGLVSAAIDRAMLELGKQGAKASQHTEALLDAATSDDRLIRSSILLALPKIAKLPCTSCETKLDAAIKAGEGKTTLAELNVETTILRNYFTWAGR